ncbi:MAG TPA: TAXI family TRAP transporter solute-binding subunit [Desulfobacterales bacterium]|nr:TAXI family TRAP transporter solute-binding subunit [Desulfobacterales bacterium]
MIKLRKKENLDTKEKLKIFTPAIIIVIVGFVVAYQFVAPAPPRKISIGTGSPKGAYFAFGKKYSELFAKENISLEVKITAGSAENLKLLESDSDGVDIAFVQGGMSTLADTEKLVSLGSLYFEPLWIFHQKGLSLHRLSDLKGLRVAVGEEGSGTKVLAMQLLGLNGITSKNTQLLSYPSQLAVERLLNGEIDIAFFVSTHRSSYIFQLLKSKSLKLLGLERAEAYALRYHYLHVFKLPEGVIDFQNNIPSHDLTLVAPTAQLVARSDLHPALVDLFLETAEEIHKSGGGFESRGEFPAPIYLDYELNKDAKRFYRSGPPFLQRYLPFWVATFFSRMKIMLLPLIALLYPLFKLMPPIYRWRMRSRIYRWYSELEAVDPEMNKEDLTENLEKYLSVIDNLEKKVSNISVPLAFSEELYSLRLHIDMLRNKLYKVHEGNKQIK